MNYTLLPEQNAVLDQMQLGHNVFVSGKAGCGKSHILAAFFEYAKRNRINAIFLAPTGMAALALPEAMTIYRFFDFPTNKFFAKDSDVSFSEYMRRKVNLVDTIVIDEISMVRTDLFQAEITGTFWQFPLKLAWATSIHKAQGQTLEKIHLCLGCGCFSPGQLYTALTRVRGFDSLTLDRPLRYEDALVDPQVMAFHQETFPYIN